MSYAIVFHKGSSGGLGDRITGIINVMSIANVFGKKFKVIWDIDISTLFKDTIFEYDTKIDKHDKRMIKMMDNDYHLRYRHILQTCKHCPFPNKDELYFKSNMPTSQFLYMNRHYKLDYEKDMLQYYGSLYTDLFIPTDQFLKMTQEYSKKKIIGIQIRTGDRYFYDPDDEIKKNKYNPIKDDMIECYVKELKKKIDLRDRCIYITSDNNHTIDIVRNIFQGVEILYNESAIVHIDISSDTRTFAYMFLDHYVLSKFAEELYISDYSNYGRTIALCSKLEPVYNIFGQAVSKKKLIWTKKDFDQTDDNVGNTSKMIV